MVQFLRSLDCWIIFLICLIAKLLLFATPAPASGPVEFGISWEPNTEAYLDGYEIYFKEDNPGTSYKLVGDIYVDELEDPDNPSVIITDLYNGVIDKSESTFIINSLTDNSSYYFAIKAFDTQGNVSDFSEEICLEVAGASLTNCRAADSGSGGGDGGSSGGGLEDLLDLKNYGCFVSTVQSEVKSYSRLSGACLFILCILIAGVITPGSRKNDRDRR